MAAPKVRRLGAAPIISVQTDPSIGTNIQGPSLVHAPPWVDDPLGRYYLYFADHKGAYIRLAVADELVGPWRVHVPGALQLEDSHFLTEAPNASEAEFAELVERSRRYYGATYSLDEVVTDATVPHIASPDAHIDHANKRVVMYFHGLDGLGSQVTRVAVSNDGLAFTARPEVIGRPYLRTFAHDGRHYGLVMPGQFVRSNDGLTGFEKGPRLFMPEMRHSAVWPHDGVLDVFWTRVGDAPESILRTRIDIGGDWMDWEMGDTVHVLSPELPWEGSELPNEPSRRSTAPGRVNQLRDPAIFHEHGRTYLLYAGAGESAIGIAELEDDQQERKP